MSNPNPFNVKKPASVTESRESAASPSENLPGERLVGMTFNMPHTWHTEFKMRAVQEGISMRELLFACYETYKKVNR